MACRGESHTTRYGGCLESHGARHRKTGETHLPLSTPMPPVEQRQHAATGQEQLNSGVWTQAAS